MKMPTEKTHVHDIQTSSPNSDSPNHILFISVNVSVLVYVLHMYSYIFISLTWNAFFCEKTNMVTFTAAELHW